MSASTAVVPAPGTALGASAIRLARLLRPAAAAAGAWVSTQARVRTAAGLLWPDLLVATGELPVDGILDGPPLLVVELTPAGLLRWADVAEAVVWGVAAQGGVLLAGGALTTVAARLTVPGAPWLTLPVGQLLDAAG
jgi:hypothetical protein